MRFVDTNVFVRYLAGEDMNLAEIARDVLRSSRDDSTFTTSDAVVAEIIFVLTSPKTYNLARPEVVTRLHALLQLPTCGMTNIAVVTEALFLWQHHSRLSFVDALCIATASSAQMELVTFDTALAKIAKIVRWDLRPHD